jgi:hypothetical protein
MSDDRFLTGNQWKSRFPRSGLNIPMPTGAALPRDVVDQAGEPTAKAIARELLDQLSAEVARDSSFLELLAARIAQHITGLIDARIALSDKILDLSLEIANLTTDLKVANLKADPVGRRHLESEVEGTLRPLRLN